MKITALLCSLLTVQASLSTGTIVDRPLMGSRETDVVRDLAEMGLRSYASEPRRGRRNWKGKEAEREAVYANRRRIRGERGKRLLRKRGELLERPFAHCYGTGGLRRTHLRGHEKILKRLLIHTAACNLSLLMRRLFGAGTPRGLRGLAALVAAALKPLLGLLRWRTPRERRVNLADRMLPPSPQNQILMV